MVFGFLSNKMGKNVASSLGGNKSKKKTPAMDMDVGVGPESIFPTGPGGNPLHYGTHIAMKGKQQVKTRSRNVTAKKHGGKGSTRGKSR
jgi:hypothetical protein